MHFFLFQRIDQNTSIKDFVFLFLFLTYIDQRNDTIFCRLKVEKTYPKLKGTVKMLIDFAEKDTLIIDKKRDVFFKLNP